MITKIKKRDGRDVPFNLEKIAGAIYKASSADDSSISYEKALDLADKVSLELDENFKNEMPTVEATQDCVEKTLMTEGYAETAKKYILYRAERTRVREMNNRLMKTYEDLTFQDAKDSDVKRENANIDGNTAMGTMLKYGSEGSKHFYEMYILNPKHSEAHKNGDIHIHDLDFLTLTTTCCQIDLIKLFKDGFSTGHGYLREPNDIQSYSALACIAIQSNQNDQHGGQSIVNFDYAMAMGVAKTYVKRYAANLIRALELILGLDGIIDPSFIVKSTIKEIKEKYKLQPKLETKKEYYTYEQQLLMDKFSNIPGISVSEIARSQKFATKKAEEETNSATFQAMEAFIHNLNTMNSRAGAQTPFSSVNYGMDTSPEGRMAVKNLLIATESGLGHGETAIFPIQIFRVKDGINYFPQDPNYDLFELACRVSAKRLFPNFSFQDAPFNLKYYKEGHPETEIAYMGCRTRVIANVHDRNKEVSNGRGNLSFTSINLPRLGIEAKGDVDKFFKDLDEKIDLVIDQLNERFEIQARKKVKNYPFLMGQGVWIDSDKLDREDEVREVLKNGTLSIGFIGLAECLVALTGKHHGESKESQELGLRIIGHMRERMDAESEKTGLNYTLIATPAEGLSGRFVKIDKKKYGILPGITDRDYYTNSFHVPVYYPIKAIDKINIEAPYHELTNAGHITYVELDGDPTKNLAAFMKIIRAMHDAGIGYGSVNHPVDRDPECGYTGIINDECPKCGRHTGDDDVERIRRITGYLVGTLDRFNDAKKAEEHDRVKHGM
ncbi:MAG: anaerobic ribonucleoside triphosphate reductase [Clostridiales bacterium]|nr:anaerobic ribonucleoside triphosphate reductase [Clostridiales bacterium]